MESLLPPPPPFTFLNNEQNVTSGNVSKDWEKWKKSFEIYSVACELGKKDAKVQINTLLHVIGEQGREVYEQFSDTFADLNSLLSKFDSFFLLRKNITVQRHSFFTRDQKDGESIEQYSFELKKLANKCEFKDLCDDLVRDRLICGIKDTTIRERLLREPTLTLQKAIDICNIAQMSRVQAGVIKKESTEQHAYYIEVEVGVAGEAGASLDHRSRAPRLPLAPPPPDQLFGDHMINGITESIMECALPVRCVECPMIIRDVQLMEKGACGAIG
ncbi:uncharacterized protein LOC134750761 [Cydia strobilella]|uniref:uncharacterized protein LOC134750761 n=1 Tax=Cydia strobilella TaxID=1100964 RepID=UPI003005947C